MTKDNKLSQDPQLVLFLLPYIGGKINAARVFGEYVTRNDTAKKLDDMEKFDADWLEYMKAATKMVNYLSGAFDAIDEVFGKGYAKEVFERVINSHQEEKADRKLKEQVDAVRRYLADPEHNASKLAREIAGNDRLATSALRNLNRWRQDERIADLAKLNLALDTTPFGGEGVPSLKEILDTLAKVEGSPDKP
jgi:hypothetical protein